jgi:hypothetical protein
VAGADTDDLHQELTADYRTLELAADRYHLGYQMGLATPMRIVQRWRARETELAFAQACAGLVGRFHPALLDEYRGYAVAQGRAGTRGCPTFRSTCQRERSAVARPSPAVYPPTAICWLAASMIS